MYKLFVKGVKIIIMGIIIFIVLLLALVLSFGFACLFTWAICFVAGLLGVTLVFSWKLALAIWIISSVFSSIKTIRVVKE